ncbi:hypothetical protein AGMMS49975_06190 [Clostridia bacterium]|nr:hypothetical protein AGMMS49975_06190 [Clostridia bacterium]
MICKNTFYKVLVFLLMATLALAMLSVVSPLNVFAEERGPSGSGSATLNGTTVSVSATVLTTGNVSSIGVTKIEWRINGAISSSTNPNGWKSGSKIEKTINVTPADLYAVYVRFYTDWYSPDSDYDNQRSSWYACAGSPIKPVNPTPPTFTLPPTSANVANGTYTIETTLTSGKVVGMYNGDRTDGTKAILYSKNNNSTYQQFTLTRLSDNTYKIIAVHSGKALSVDSGSNSQGADVVQLDFNNNLTYMHWYIVSAGNGNYSFVNKVSGMYLDVSGANTANGTRIQQYAGNGTSAQIFKLVSVTPSLPSTSADVSNGTYTIETTLTSDKVIDIYNADKINNANAILYSKTNSANQQFTFTRLSDNTYKIVAVHSGMALNTSGSAIEGIDVVQSTFNESESYMHWYVVSAGNGNYSFVNKNSGMYFDVSNASTANGTRIQQYAGNGTPAQIFKLVSVPTSLIPSTSANVNNGTYTIETTLTSDKVIDIYNANTASRTAAILYSKDANSTNQQFTLTRLSDNTYKIAAVHSGNVLSVDSGSTADGASVVQSTFKESLDYMHWYIVSVGNGNYSFVNKNSGKYLDVRGGNTTNNTRIQQYTGNGTSAQIFKLVPVSTVPTINSFSVNKNSYTSGETVTATGNVSNYGSWKIVWLNNGSPSDTMTQSNSNKSISGSGTVNSRNYNGLRLYIYPQANYIGTAVTKDAAFTVSQSSTSPPPTTPSTPTISSFSTNKKSYTTGDTVTATGNASNYGSWKITWLNNGSPADAMIQSSSNKPIAGNGTVNSTNYNGIRLYVYPQANYGGTAVIKDALFTVSQPSTPSTPSTPNAITPPTIYGFYNDKQVPAGQDLTLTGTYYNGTQAVRVKLRRTSPNETNQRLNEIANAGNGSWSYTIPARLLEAGTYNLSVCAARDANDYAHNNWITSDHSDTTVSITVAENTAINTMTNVLYGISTSSSNITCGFDKYTTTSGRHEGIDFFYGIGKSVYSLIDGQVIRVTTGSTGSSGLSTIAIYDASSNKTVIYLHTSPSVSVGDSVSRGQKIATESWRGVSTSSSAHTHIEVVKGYSTAAKKSVDDPILENENPTPYWQSKGYRVY